MTWSGSGSATVRFATAITDAMVVTTTWTGSTVRNTVVAIDGHGNQTDRLVDATGDYEGSSLVNRVAGSTTAALRIQGEGRWQVSLKPLTDATQWEGTQPLVGQSDDVVVVRDAFSGPGSITFTSQASGPVSVVGLGETTRTIVKGDGSFTGQYHVPAETVIFMITSAGRWSVSSP